jgi:peptide/nickel transport system ATP-binding protein
VSEALLRVSDLRTELDLAGGTLRAVDGVDLEIRKGECFALVGESGCGKSMTALSLLRLLPEAGRIAAGRVLLEGQDLLALPEAAMRAVRGRRVAMIFQEPSSALNPVLTIGRQIAEVVERHFPRQNPGRKALALLEAVGLPDAASRLEQYPFQLSGGQKQRVMIAAALAADPEVLIADEPTTALDVTIQAQILELLRELQREVRTAILLITHDIGVVNELADRVAVMYAGRIVEEGARREVLVEGVHPYTRGLLRSIPGRAKHGERLAEIPGTVPSPGQWTAGCRFAKRCPQAMPVCREHAPKEEWIAPGHRVACFAVTEESR